MLALRLAYLVKAFAVAALPTTLQCHLVEKAPTRIPGLEALGCG